VGASALLIAYHELDQPHDADHRGAQRQQPDDTEK
jgi:hypothetical protein